MASTYMRNYRNQAESDRDLRIKQEISENSQEEDRLRAQMQREISYKVGLGPPVLICAGIGVVFAIIWNVVWLPIMIAVGFVIRGFIWAKKNKAIQEFNRKLQNEIDENSSQLTRKCDAIRSACAQKIAAEEKRYKQKVVRARQAYGGSVVLTPIINWLMSSFSHNIQSADRNIYQPVIEASIYFDVYESEIHILARNPHSGSFDTVGTPFSLKYNGQVHYQNIPEFFDRIGFAQALTKQLQFEVAKRYSVDPVAPMRGVVPKVTFEYDDSRMQVIYRVQNPNYQAPVNLKKGICGN